ncbi:MAG: PLDc N-terminal domain-containing protein [Mycobacteriaceae bacterium]
MSFLNTLWLIVISFAFIAYLIVLFTIVTDLFRDRNTSGATKAVWLVLLFVFPLVTGLIYLIVRGGGMAERSHAFAAHLQTAREDYIRDVAGTSPAAEIAEAKKLLESGAITESEYAAIKAKVLA